MTDFDYMVESVTADLVVLLMERLEMDLQTCYGRLAEVYGDTLP